MRKILMVCLLLMTMGASAQTDLTGRVYYHPNIMADELEKAIDESKDEIDKARTKAITDLEKKKGRKLTAEELKRVDDEIVEAKKLTEVLKKAIKTSVTVTFKDEKTMTMKAKMFIDDNAMKTAGISWAKRKLLKMTTAISPTEKGTYVVAGDKVIMSDGKDLDTLRLSNDGKFLSGKMDDKKSFQLRRIQ